MILDLQRLPLLETVRLKLDPLTIEDAPHLFSIVGDPEVMAYWDVPEIDDPDVVAEVVIGQVEAMAAGSAVHWSLRTLDSGEFLGVCDLAEIDRRHRRAEVGFILGRESAGQGYGLEAISTVVAFAATSGLRKLGARTLLGNRRSEQILEKLGFEEEGLLRGHILKDGDRRDCRLWGLLL